MCASSPSLSPSFISEALAREPHTSPSSPINVTDEKGEELPLKRRSQTDAATSPVSPPSPVYVGDLRPHSSSVTGSLHRQPDAGPYTSPRGCVAAHRDPVLKSTPFNKKSAPIVAKTDASSSGVSYFSSEVTTSEQLVMGDELDFMKLSLRVQSISPEAIHVQPTSAARVASSNDSVRPGQFRSILLFIPLRLGQDTFNTNYSDALKVRI